MSTGRRAGSQPKRVETITHKEASRENIPSAEHQSFMKAEKQSPILVAYEGRSQDLDPQLDWRGKDEQEWSGFVVQAPPLNSQEKAQPKSPDRRPPSHKPLSTA
ncbi:MAG: hypothetical protein ACKVVP_10555 [Chloroflexota bacterium]